MATPQLFGPRAAIDLLYAVGGMDAARILNLKMREGLSMEQVLQLAGAAVGGANEYLMNKYAGMMYTTDTNSVKYRQGTASAGEMRKKVQGVRSNPIRGSATGHMLPWDSFDTSLAWNEEYLRDAYRADLEIDLAEVRDLWVNRFEGDLWRRCLTTTENAEGSGYDVGWAIGTGTNVNFIPPQFGAQSFDTTHTHYEYSNAFTAAGLKTLIDNMVKNIRHHGIEGQLVAFVADADVATWATVSGFVTILPANMTIVSAPTSSQVVSISGEVQGVPGTAFGYYTSARGTVELRYVERIPTGYAFLTCAYGADNPMNALALRVHPTVPFGLMPDPKGNGSLNLPKMEYIDLQASFGIGVWRREAGVAGYAATSASAYVNPTI